MKQVLMAISGMDFSESAFEFAKRLNEIESITLCGFFLPQSITPVYEGVNAVIEPDKSLNVVAGNVEHFVTLCTKNNIAYKVLYGDYTLPMPQIIKQTRFSDVFLAGSDVFFRSFKSEDPHHHLYRALHESECPLIIVPEKCSFPENIVLAYDGSASSVYAIKQFAYIFPVLCKKGSILVYEGYKGNETIPDADGIKELAASHFNEVQYLELNAETDMHFNAWLKAKENILVVAGAGGRNAISEFFKKSFAEGIVATHKYPLFIAHP